MNKIIRFILVGLTAIATLIPGFPFTGKADPAGIDVPVYNQGFELDTRGWSQTFGSGGVSISTDRSYVGEHSLKLVDTSVSQAVGMESDPLAASPGITYTATVQVYLESGGVQIYLRYYNSSNQLISSKLAGITTPLNTWNVLSASSTAPSGTTSIRILLYIPVSTTGNAYFDAVGLTREPVGNIANNGFETGLTGWTQNFGTGGITLVNSPVYAVTSSVKFDDLYNYGALGLESDKVPVVPGSEFTASTKVNLVSGNATIYIRFYDAAGTMLLQTAGITSSPTGQWIDISVMEKAPAGTASASILLYTDKANQGSCYFDNVNLKESVTPLGPQIYVASIVDAVFDEANHMAYTVISGRSPALFIGINLDTHQVTTALDLDSSQGSWGLAKATDGTIYIGTYQGGNLFSYDPSSGQLVKRVSSGQFTPQYPFLFDMKAGDNGTVYMGSYPSGNVYQYDPAASSISTVYTNPYTNSSQSPYIQYARSVAYNAADQVLYVGTGSQPLLRRIDLVTNAIMDILPAEYTGETSVYNLDYVGGKLFAVLDPSRKMAVLNESRDANGNLVITKDAEVAAVNSYGVSQPYQNKVYFTNMSTGDVRLYAYDLNAKTYSQVSTSSFVGNAHGFGWVELNDQAGNPGQTLMGITSNYGFVHLIKYNPTTGNTEDIKVDYSGIPTVLFNLAKGPDGKIYSGSYLVGQTGVYTPYQHRMSEDFYGLAQPEGMGEVSGKLIVGTYPHARIYAVDPSLPWDTDVNNGNNPKFLFDMFNEGQDRPKAIAGGDGKLFVGSVAFYGQLTGALAVYDMGTSTLQTIDTSVVDQQSILSLAYQSGTVYGGTTIWGGLGIAPATTEGKLFEYDVATGQKTHELVPVAGMKTISALFAAPDGMIWGIADNTLFLYNPNTHVVDDVRTIANFTVTQNSASRLLSGNDGWIYGSVEGRLFKVDPTTRQIVIIKSSGVNGLTRDDFGNLYYFDNENLYRYTY